jgi:hypothetical protein
VLFNIEVRKRGGWRYQANLLLSGLGWFRQQLQNFLPLLKGLIHALQLDMFGIQPSVKAHWKMRNH